MRKHQVAFVLVAVCAVFAIGATSASAVTTVQRTGQTVIYNGDAAANGVTVEKLLSLTQVGHVRITSPEQIVNAGGCYVVLNPILHLYQAVCGPFQDVLLNAGPGNDDLTVKGAVDAHVGLGSGEDRYVGGTGSDLVDTGPDAALDRVTTGAGNDVVTSNDGLGSDVISCGTGNDLWLADPFDINLAGDCNP